MVVSSRCPWEKAASMRGTITHELMHAIGFFHEHSRPDRDKYIDVFLENVKPGFEGQFTKVNIPKSRLITDFDYKSIMLYGSTAFAIDKESPTMLKKDGGKLQEVHDKYLMSGLDMLALPENSEALSELHKDVKEAMLDSLYDASFANAKTPQRSPLAKPRHAKVKLGDMKAPTAKSGDMKVAAMRPLSPPTTVRRRKRAGSVTSTHSQLARKKSKVSQGSHASLHGAKSVSVSAAKYRLDRIIKAWSKFDFAIEKVWDMHTPLEQIFWAAIWFVIIVLCIIITCLCDLVVMHKKGEQSFSFPPVLMPRNFDAFGDIEAQN
ncbi:hypothetical protein MTO96_032051 [Rhipicephalus appendiculatus]